MTLKIVARMSKDQAIIEMRSHLEHTGERVLPTAVRTPCPGPVLGQRSSIDPECAGARETLPGLHATPPLGYLDMLALLDRDELVLTDSGGMAAPPTA